MSLGKPDLYIGGQKMKTGKLDRAPVLAGLTLTWGNDSRFDYDPPATLAGELLMRDAMAPYLHVGAPVGLVDPATARTLFAGHLQPLTARPEPSVAGAMRVSFSAAAPRAELEEHTVLDVDWHGGEPADSRRARIGSALPRGWGYGGAPGFDWIAQGQQRYQNIRWLVLAERYARGNLQRMHDISNFVPQWGIYKRLYFTPERPKTAPLPAPDPGTGGVWVPGNPTQATGTAVLPAGAVSPETHWEKTPDDVVTAVQVTTWGMVLAGQNLGAENSVEHEWPLDYSVDSTAIQDTYGFRQLRVETALSAQNTAASKAAHEGITRHWLDTQTDWRPTTLTLPDSRRLAAEPLLNLLAVDTRHLAAVNVPDQPAALPARIRAFVLGGRATWTGKKWTTELTLGRTQP